MRNAENESVSLSRGQGYPCTPLKLCVYMFVRLKKKFRAIEALSSLAFSAWVVIYGLSSEHYKKRVDDMDTCPLAYMNIDICVCVCVCALVRVSLR